MVSVLQRHEHITSKDIYDAFSTAEARVRYVEAATSRLDHMFNQTVGKVSVAEGVAQRCEGEIGALRQQIQALSSGLGRIHTYVGCPQVASQIRPPTFELEEANKKIVQLGKDMENRVKAETGMFECVQNMLTTQEKERHAWALALEAKTREIAELKNAIACMDQAFHAFQAQGRNTVSPPWSIIGRLATNADPYAAVGRGTIPSNLCGS